MAFDPNDPYAQAVLQQGQAAGYSPMQIAAVLGRTGVESNYQADASGDNGNAHGYQQWSGPRFQALQQTAQTMGLPWTDPKVQATHLFNELGGSESASGQALKAAQTPADAQNAVSGYERPQGYTSADPSQSLGYNTALTNAQQIQQALTGGGPVTEGRSAADGSPGVDPTPTGSIPAILPQGNPATPQQPQDDLGSGLYGLAAALSARDSPGAASVYQNLAKQNSTLAKAQAITDKGTTDNGKYRVSVDNTGHYTYTPVPVDAQTPDAAPKVAEPKPVDVKTFQANDYQATNAKNIIDAVNPIREQIAAGNVGLTWDARAKQFIANATGNSTMDSTAMKDLEANLNRSVTSILSQEKGSAQKFKFEQAMNQFTPSGGKYDPSTMLGALDRVTQDNQAIYKSAATVNASYLKRFPDLAGNLTDPDGKPVDADAQTKAYSDNLNGINAFQNEFKGKQAAFNQKHWAASNGGAAPPPAITSPDDFAKLPSGASFIAPDGKTWKKN